MPPVNQDVSLASTVWNGPEALKVIGVAYEDEADQYNLISYHMVKKLCWVGA